MFDIQKRVEGFNRLLDGLVERMRAQPTFGWATVVAVAPLQIRYDGQTDPVAGSPSGDTAGLRVGDRVWCQRIHRRDIVLVRPGGASSRLLRDELNIYLHATQQVGLPVRVRDLTSGLVLVWSEYTNGQPLNIQFQSFFFSKETITRFPGHGHFCHLVNWGAQSVRKYVYISDTQIKGHAMNAEAPSNGYVLRQVVGV